MAWSCPKPGGVDVHSNLCVASLMLYQHLVIQRRGGVVVEVLCCIMLRVRNGTNAIRRKVWINIGNNYTKGGGMTMHVVVVVVVNAGSN
jgi:hypothetical protein